MGWSLKWYMFLQCPLQVRLIHTIHSIHWVKLNFNSAHTQIFSDFFLIYIQKKITTKQFFTNMHLSFKNVTEKLPLLGLARLNFLPVGSSVCKVGESKFGPHVTSKLICPQLAFTWNWEGEERQEQKSWIGKWVTGKVGFWERMFVIIT